MASRKEEKERLRAERLAAQQHDEAAAKRRLMLGYVVAGGLTLAVLIGLVLVIASGGGDSGKTCGEAAHTDPTSGTVPEDVGCDEREGTAPPPIQIGDLNEASKAAGCNLMEDLPQEGRTHIEQSAPTPQYKTNPPTSGNHDPTPLADGAYSDAPNPRNFVHSLEHGRIEIQYSPNLPKEDQLALKGVFDDDPAGMLMFPNPDMPYQVAVTAWTNLVGCPKYDETVLDVVRDFRDTYRGNGPEAVPL